MKGFDVMYAQNSEKILSYRTFPSGLEIILSSLYPWGITQGGIFLHWVDLIRGTSNSWLVGTATSH